MKILVLGSSGMAGHMIYHYLGGLDHQVVGIGRNAPVGSVDVTDRKALDEVLEKHKDADYIINCIGVLVNESTHSLQKALYINAWLPHYIQEKIEYNTRLIHLSTDCVFSGDRGHYKVDDPKDAKDNYGKTKALGEVVESGAITIRMSIIGPEIKDNGRGLFHWFMTTEEVRVSGYTNAIWNGLTTLELARFINYTIHQNPVAGIHQIAAPKPVTKYHLLQELRETFKRPTLVQQGWASKDVNKVLCPMVDCHYDVPSLKNMLAQLKEWMDSHPELYKDYYDFS